MQAAQAARLVVAFCAGCAIGWAIYELMYP